MARGVWQCSSGGYQQPQADRACAIVKNHADLEQTAGQTQIPNAGCSSGKTGCSKSFSFDLIWTTRAARRLQFSASALCGPPQGGPLSRLTALDVCARRSTFRFTDLAPFPEESPAASDTDSSRRYRSRTTARSSKPEIFSIDGLPVCQAGSSSLSETPVARALKS